MVSKDFSRMSETAGLPHIRLHDCRHTAVSLMLLHGIPAIIVAGIIGDTLEEMSRTYAHYIPSSQDAASKIMDSITTVIEVDLTPNP